MAMSQTMIWHGEVVLSLELARQMLAMTPADIQRAIASGRLTAVRTPDGWRVPRAEAFRALGEQLATMKAKSAAKRVALAVK